MPTTADPSSPDPTVIVRPFRRDDRDQLTQLVNAHVAAVVPGLTVSVNAVLSQLERDPGDFIVDRWVATRHTLVAVQRGRLVAATHLLTYRDDPDVADWARGRGELRWLLCWPDAPFWPNAGVAGLALARAAVAVLLDVGCRRVGADGALPAPGLFGIPEQWPHIVELLTAVGFAPGQRREHVLLADLDALPQAAAPPGLVLRRTLGTSGTRFTALDGGEEVGFIDVDLCPTDLGRTSTAGGWADVGNLEVVDVRRRQGVGRWLVGEAAHWLRLGHVDRLLDYCDPEDAGYLAFAEAVGFVRLTTTRRGWELDVDDAGERGARMAR